jgi:hypothetical protein
LVSAVVVGAEVAAAARARVCTNSGGGTRTKKRSAAVVAVDAADVKVVHGGERSKLAITEGMMPVALWASWALREIRHAAARHRSRLGSIQSLFMRDLQVRDGGESNCQKLRRRAF